jgi:hypothetical protein
VWSTLSVVYSGMEVEEKCFGAVVDGTCEW